MDAAQLEIVRDPRVILAIDSTRKLPTFGEFDDLAVRCWGVQLNNSIHGNEKYHALLDRATNTGVPVLLNVLESHEPDIFAQNLEEISGYGNIEGITVSGMVEVAWLKGYRQAVDEAGMNHVAVFAQGYSTNQGEEHCRDFFGGQTPREVTRKIVRNAIAAKIQGIKASAKDMEGFFAEPNNGLEPDQIFRLIANGIRRSGDKLGRKDSDRVTDGTFAFAQRASKLIVGSIVMNAPQRIAALDEFIADLPPCGPKVG